MWPIKLKGLVALFFILSISSAGSYKYIVVHNIGGAVDGDDVANWWKIGVLSNFATVKARQFNEMMISNDVETVCLARDVSPSSQVQGDVPPSAAEACSEPYNVWKCMAFSPGHRPPAPSASDEIFMIAMVTSPKGLTRWNQMHRATFGTLSPYGTPPLKSMNPYAGRTIEVWEPRDDPVGFMMSHDDYVMIMTFPKSYRSCNIMEILNATLPNFNLEVHMKVEGTDADIKVSNFSRYIVVQVGYSPLGMALSLLGSMSDLVISKVGKSCEEAVRRGNNVTTDIKYRIYSCAMCGHESFPESRFENNNDRS